MSYNILVTDDDADIRSAIKIYLEQEGYHVFQAENGQVALDVLSKEEIHLVLLDVMMPVLDGITTAVKIREISNIPIIFLSAKSEDTDRILGLKMGADDYMTKPFNPIELQARVGATIRRYAQFGGMDVATTIASSKSVYRTGGLQLDDNQKRVTVDGEEVSLTAIEYKILKLLGTHLDQVFSSDQIYEHVWEEPAMNISKTVAVHIRHIREKIEVNPKEPRYLKVVYGLGYKLVTIA
jgi:DNA-binding response OmpR family regulator